MKKLVKYLIFLLLFIIAIGVSWYSGFKTSFSKKHVEESQELVLDRVKKVTKLVAVEGYFSELYNHEQYQSWFPILKKEAIIRVKAKVSVGFDFDSMTVETYEDQNKIVISDFPVPSIISVDHDLDYYDVKDWTLYRFSEKDYNNINTKAKDFIKRKAMDSQLRESAFEREKELKDMMKLICRSMGWELEFKEKDTNPPYSG